MAGEPWVGNRGHERSRAGDPHPRHRHGRCGHRLRRLPIVFGIVGPDQEPHAFHNAIVAALLIVISAPPVVAIAIAPERPIRPLVLLAAIGVVAVGTMVIALTIDPFTMPFVVLAGVLWAARVDRSDPFPSEQADVPLVVLTGIAAVGLFPYAWDQAGLQRVDHQRPCGVLSLGRDGVPPRRSRSSAHWPHIGLAHTGWGAIQPAWRSSSWALRPSCSPACLRPSAALRLGSADRRSGLHRADRAAPTSIRVSGRLTDRRLVAGVPSGRCGRRGSGSRRTRRWRSWRRPASAPPPSR